MAIPYENCHWNKMVALYTTAAACCRHYYFIPTTFLISWDRNSETTWKSDLDLGMRGPFVGIYYYIVGGLRPKNLMTFFNFYDYFKCRYCYTIFVQAQKKIRISNKKKKDHHNQLWGPLGCSSLSPLLNSALMKIVEKVTW